MASNTPYTVRTLDQEIDTIEICPSCSDYTIVGTYHLVKDSHLDETGAGSDEGPSQTESKRTVRIGSLQILPINYGSRSMNEAQVASICRYDIDSAILDIHFCPTDASLLGAATSTGELRFFKILGLPVDVDQPLDQVEIVPLGIADISDDSTDTGNQDSVPLITQFTWVKSINYPGAEASDDAAYYLATCDTFGCIKIVKIFLSGSEGGRLERDNPVVSHLKVSTVTIHQHLYGLEAWTLSNISLKTIFGGNEDYVVLSGGDDSCLITSKYSLKPTDIDRVEDITEKSSFVISQQRVQVDKRTHTSGVICILPIPQPQIPIGDGSLTKSMLVLTGSYDQNLRLLLLDLDTFRVELESSIELEGGVWRILLLDTYTVKNTAHHGSEQHYILLVSVMYAGCYIMRLVCTGAKGPSLDWLWTVEVHFANPHESMVYACVAKMLDVDDERGRLWRVISTSFYDKRICVWDWRDKVNQGNIERMR